MFTRGYRFLFLKLSDPKGYRPSFFVWFSKSRLSKALQEAVLRTFHPQGPLSPLFAAMATCLAVGTSMPQAYVWTKHVALADFATSRIHSEGLYLYFHWCSHQLPYALAILQRFIFDSYLRWQLQCGKLKSITPHLTILKIITSLPSGNLT